MGEFYDNMSEAEKIFCIQALKFVLQMEKRNCKDNEDYLKKKISEFGLTKTMLTGVPAIRSNAGFIKEAKNISSIRTRRFILKEMIMIAIANHEISDEEIAAIYELGMGIGIKQEKINDFFLWAAQGMEWQLEGIKLIEKDI